MLLFSCIKIKKDFGDTTVLKSVDFDVNLGERIGLVGNNGAGKTTLANIIAGKLKLDAGKVEIFKQNINIGYLYQDASYSISTYEEDNVGGFLENASILGLKKIKDWEENRLEGLSGGEKTKIALARIWSAKPDMLILDEPTNHMDFQGVEWLISEISRFDGTLIIISHDRYFLDKSVERIIEIENGIANNFSGNYSFYRDEKKRQYESQLNQYINEKKYKEKIRGQIDVLNNWSNKAHDESREKALATGNKFGGKEYNRAKAKKMDKQIKSRIKKLEKLEIQGIEKPEEEQKINFAFISDEKRGKAIIEAREIMKKYNERTLFMNSSFYIKRGEHIGLIGANGCGKTTLINIVLGKELLSSGELWVSPSIKIAYLSQSSKEIIEDETILQMLDATEGNKATIARTLLANMGFDQEMVNRKMGVLSLGERTRIRIAKLILQENDVLILDEPTNHLDLHSRECLEETLVNYNGTIILASHDRYMLERVCSTLLVYEEQQIKRIDRDFKEYKSKPIEKGSNTKKELAEEKMLIENRISIVLGELCNYSPGDEKYINLDREFKELLKKKKELTVS